MLDPAARAKLLEVFQEEGGDYPSKERREELARDLGLPLVKVSNWFGSKRFSEKKNLDKNNRKKKKEEKKKKSTGCPFERARARVLSQCQRIRKEQWLLETYAMEGWRGASKEKLKPRQELERASRSIAKAKETIQDSMRFIEEGGGHTPIPKDLYTNSGELDQGEIFCGKCLSGVAHDDNDIVLCDGFCGCAFHQKCLDPPLEVIPEDDGWLCPSCSVKCDCIYYLNNLFNTSMPLETPWHAIYTYEEDNSDSDSESERGAEGSGSGNGKKRKRKRDYHRGKPNESEGGNAVIAALNAIANTDDEDESEDDDFEQQESESSESSSTSSESSEVIAEVVEGKRRRTKVDYRKLNEAMFGEGEAYEGEVVSDQEWNPLSSPEASKPETSMKAKKMPSKNRPYQSTLDPVAYEKLREVFRETDYPSKERRKKLAEELKLPIQKVNNWFGSQRFHLKKKNTITEGGTTTPKRRSLDDLATNGFGGGKDALFAAINALSNSDEQRESEGDDSEEQESMESESSESSSTSSESSEVIAEVVEGKRRRTKVDYRKLNEAMFGEGEAYEGEVVSDQEWNPLSSPEASKPETSMKAKKMPSKNRPYQSTLDPVAYEKLREVFRETDYPSKERRKKLAEELKLPIQKVNNWFGSQRFHLKKKNTISEGGTTTPKRRSLDDLATNGSRLGHDVVLSSGERKDKDKDKGTVASGRSMLNSAASAKLHQVFRETQTPSKERREELAREFNLPIKKVNNWFGSQRFRLKKKANTTTAQGDYYEEKRQEDESGEENPLFAALHVISQVEEKKKTPSKQQKSRSNLDPAAAAKFREVFQETPLPSKEKREELAREFNLPIKKVSNWFGSQRFQLAKARKKPDVNDTALQMQQNTRLIIEQYVRAESLQGVTPD